MFLIQETDKKTGRTIFVGYSLDEAECCECVDLMKDMDTRNNYNFKVLKITSEQFYAIEDKLRRCIPMVSNYYGYALTEDQIDIIEENENNIICDIEYHCRSLRKLLKLFKDKRCKNVADELKEILNDINRDDDDNLMCKFDHEKVIEKSSIL